MYPSTEAFKGCFALPGALRADLRKRMMFLLQRRPLFLAVGGVIVYLVFFLSYRTSSLSRRIPALGLVGPKKEEKGKEPAVDVQGAGVQGVGVQGVGVQGADVQDVFNATLGFEKIFVINLPARTDHRDAMLLTALSGGIELDWIDGIRGEDVHEKAIPPPPERPDMLVGGIGCWRAHMNALAKIVQLNISTALIMEDDADWDVRIKSQLRDFALSAHALIQPLASNPNTYADPTYPSPTGKPAMPPDMYFDRLPPTVPPVSSPYGDGWDILWLGHCGVNLPTINSKNAAERSRRHAKGRVVHLHDETVPEKKYLDLFREFEDPLDTYPPHSRIVHHPIGSVCSLAYAVTQASARRMLYEMGVKSFSSALDLMLTEYCDGANGRDYHTCLTVQPQLFNHHRPVGKLSSESDISNHGDSYRDKAETAFIRWSARINLDRYFSGQEGYDDQFPDS
ncbi:MAG: hypothetical protein M1839_009134 [Geoglossum umbratile]|nr:MAG: hypothetical protein M1839_009134 [Geoglossum umbratile]